MEQKGSAVPTTTPPGHDHDGDGDPPRIGLSQELRERTLAELYAAWEELQRAVQVPVDLGAVDAPERLLEAGRRVAKLDRVLKCMAAIALVVVRGQGWHEVGARLGMAGEDAELLYGDAVMRWCSGDGQPWAPRVVGLESAPEGREVVA